MLELLKTREFNIRLNEHAINIVFWRLGHQPCASFYLHIPERIAKKHVEYLYDKEADFHYYELGIDSGLRGLPWPGGITHMRFESGKRLGHGAYSHLILGADFQHMWCNELKSNELKFERMVFEAAHMVFNHYLAKFDYIAHASNATEVDKIFANLKLSETDNDERRS